MKFPPCFCLSSATPFPAVPTKTTSFYDTSLGTTASLAWSRTLLGLSVIADLQLFASPAANNNEKSSAPNQEFNIHELRTDNLQFRVSLPLRFRRKGSKTLHLKSSSGRRCRVNLTWDLSRATFSRAFGPEPLAGFFFTIAVDGEMLLLAGDRPNEAIRRIKTVRPRNGAIAADPFSKKVEVKLGEIGRNPSWKATARFAGREREIVVWFDLEKRRMGLTMNGESVLHVRRLRWNFRGSERVEMEGGDRVHVSWDLFRFLFTAEAGDAVIVVRIENVGEGQGHFRKREGLEFCGKSGDWSEGSSRSWTTVTSSEDWDVDGFTLVICARKG